MIDHDLDIDDDDLVLSVTSPKKLPRATYPVWLIKKLKEYDKILEAKLPNEFRGAITNYNHRSSSDYLIDEDKYGFF